MAATNYPFVSTWHIKMDSTYQIDWHSVDPSFDLDWHRFTMQPTLLHGMRVKLTKQGRKHLGNLGLGTILTSHVYGMTKFSVLFDKGNRCVTVAKAYIRILNNDQNKALLVEAALSRDAK